MTTAAAILEELQQLGVELEISGEKLRYIAPRGVITDALRARLVEHKSEIVFLLSVGNGALLSAPPIARRKNDGANTAPLSFGQERLWFLNQLEPASPFYNVCLAVRLLGGLNLEALHGSFNEVVRRHEILRTSFAVVGEQPLQVIAPSLTLPLTVIDLGEIPHSGREAHALRLASEESRQPFDLTRGPLLRVTLLKLSDQEHILLLTVHHIIFDGGSIGILFGEIAAAYEAYCAGKPPRLPELAVQFADFARWQRGWLQGEVLKSHLAYWKQRLDGAALVLELPADHSRPATQTYSGAKYTIALSSRLTEALKALCKQEGVTLFIALLAAFKTLIYRYTGQEDLLIGTPVANRVKSELEPLVGFFVNTLVMRTALWGNQTFRELLRQVHQSALGAYAHQSLPFEKLVDELHPEREASRAPLLQTMFVLQNAPLPITKMADLSLVPLEIDNGTAKFDLLLSLREAEPGLVGALEYSTDLFEAATIARMAKHLETLLEAVVDNPNQRLSGLPLMTSQERQRLREWNETRAAYPGPECIHELFEQQVQRTPDAISVIFNGEQITYEELDRKANQLAHHLRALGVGAETLVGICTERNIKMVIGLLGILKAGGAYVPLDPAYPKERLAFVLEDAGLPVLVTQMSLRDKLPEHQARAVYLDTEWDIIAQERMDNLASGVRENNLAYVIYTSGSTGRPKGVAIEHRSPVVLLHWAKDVFVDENWAGVLASTSICFDLSVFELFVPLSWGGKVILAENALHLPNLPAAEEVTLINTVPSAMTELLKADGVPASVRTVNLAGEALPGALVRRIYERDSIRQVFNLYGPSEDTTYSTYTLVERSDTGSPTIGRPIANTQVYLLDANFQLVPVGLPGELHIGGVGLARGYLNRPDLTAEKFLPDPFSTESGARLYRTGDVARYMEGGIIDFLGRMDHQVKVRGFRIELGEIEAVLREHDALKQALVVVREDIQGDKRLVAYVVPMTQPALSSHELRDYLKEKLPDYMVPQAFVMMSAFPLTPNGKVDRRALPAPARDCASEGEFMAPRDPFEEEVAAIWASVLGLQEVGIHSNFFELGGHSLLGMQVISRLRKAFQIELPVRRLFESPSVADLAECIKKERVEKIYMRAPAMRTIDRKGKLPMSFSQWRLWFLDQLMPDNSAYNIFQALRLSGPLNVEALQRSFNEILRRHEVLRTYFAKEAEEPVQIIVRDLTLELPLTDISSLPPSEQESRIQQAAIKEASRKFNLAEVPLLRITLFKESEHEHVLFLTMHHIITDGWSIGIFIKEVAALYRAYSTGEQSKLKELELQYADYATWQREWLQGDVLDEQLSFWKSQLADAPAHIDLPIKRSAASADGKPVGNRHSFLLPAELSKSLRALSINEGTTLFMTLLAGFQVLLYRYSGQTDIVIGTPIANRSRVEIEALIGFFVNTLALRTQLSGELTVRELLGRVRDVALDAYAHQDLPFEKLVEELQPDRDLSRHPLFQVMFVLQNAPQQELDLDGLKLSPITTTGEAAKFELTLMIIESGAELKGVIKYDTSEYEEATIRRMAEHYQVVLAQMAGSVEKKLSQLAVMTEEEKQRLIYEWNETSRDYDTSKSVQELFERQAQRTPEAVAVESEGEQLSYKELNQRANQLGRYLRDRGVEVEEAVGICVERSVEMVVAVLGVLKAAGAYLPVEASYPRERIRYMLADAGAKVVISQRRLSERLAAIEVEKVWIDEQWEEIAKRSKQNLGVKVWPENLAYVIYTSGSTGLPKGVMVEHASIHNLLRGLEQSIPILTQGPLRVGMSAPLSFDASVKQLIQLLAGHTLHVLPEAVRRDAAALTDYVRAESLDALDCTPSHINLLLGSGLLHELQLRLLLIGGESIDERMWQELAQNPLTAFYNVYGPTECTVDTTVCRIDIKQTHPAIGKPIANSRVYILDGQGSPAPIGVPGELCIGGLGLSRGYRNNTDQTAERFIPDPFSTSPGARLYKTGDLARYRDDGSIEFLGRVDYQVKIRGYRVELEEIESVLKQCPAVREAVVMAREDRPGNKRLVAYITSSQQEALSVSGTRSLLREKLPDYMVPSAFVILDALPLTPNGKIDRKALPVPDLTRLGDQEDFVAPRSSLEQLLAEIWTDLLGIERVGAHDNFFELGGHSLLATQLLSRLQKTLPVKLALRTIFELPTISKLAAALSQEQSEMANEDKELLSKILSDASPEGEMSGSYPTSLSQQWFLFLYDLSPGSFLYNMPYAVRLKGKIDVEALRRSIDEIVRRHEALRTTFPIVEGKRAQVIATSLDLGWPMIDLRGLPPSEREAEARRLATEEARRPFDIEQGPLIRAGLLHLAEDEYVLLLVIYHSNSDGWSMGVFTRELIALYEAFSKGLPSPLPRLAVQYKDFALWQRQWMQGEVLEEHLSYWKRQLDGAPASLNLPFDRPRPAVRTFWGESQSLVLSKELTEELKRLSVQENATLFMVLLAAFNTLLYQYTNQDDLVVITHVAGRNRPEFEGLIGYFINNLVMRSDLSGEPTFRELLARVRRVALEAYEHQELPVIKLVDALEPDLSLSLKTQVMFLLQNIPKKAFEFPNLALGSLNVRKGTVNRDLVFIVSERKDGLAGTMSYSVDLFEAPTIQRMLQSFATLLYSIVADPDKRISDFAIREAITVS